MSDKKLTQDQIDKLIKAASNNSNNTNNNSNNSVKEFIEKSIKASKDGLSLAVSSKIDCVCLHEIEKNTTKNILSMVEDKPYLGVRVDYTGQVKGFDLLLIKKDDALKLVQKQFSAIDMEFDEETLVNMRDSAAAELMNQMIGKSASILSDDYQLNVDINIPKIKEFSDKNATLEFFESEDKEYIFSSYQLIIDENLVIDIFKILELEFANNLNTLLFNNNSDTINASLMSKMEDEDDEENEEGYEYNADDYNNPVIDNLNFDDDISYSSLQKNKDSNNLFGGEHRVDNKEAIEVYPYNLSNIKDTGSSQVFDLSIQKLNDVNVELSVELGRTKKTIKEILNLGKGSILELDKLSGEPVDLYANGTLIASAEVVIVKDYFAVKILNIVGEENKL